MAGIEVKPEERREQTRELMKQRWRSWGAEVDEVLDVTASSLKEIFDLEEKPSREQVLDAADLMPSLLHPTSNVLDAIKEARGDTSEPAA